MMKKNSLILCVWSILISFSAQAQSLKTGPWRFVVKTTYAQIPFIIQVKEENGKFTGILQNGKESISLPTINITKDTISIPLLTYEMSLEMNLPKDGAMMGFLVRHNKNPIIKLHALAIHGETERFPEEKRSPKIDLNGRWAVTLTDQENKTQPGVIVFEQKGNALTGSILTPTGDYRYMEGFVSGTEFEAASFDGGYNYLFKGTLKDGKLKAKILSGYITQVEGIQDAQAKLPDAYKQTKIVNQLSFALPDLSGRYFSLKHPRFKDKPVIVQIYGSWCPNCMDETHFLIPWYNKNHKRGIEVVALAFERSLGPDEAKMQLKKTQKKMNIPYTLLIGGSTAEEKPMDKVKGLTNFISFPTTIFLDKNHQVVKVHAGFSGPSTGEFYTQWVSEFEQTVNEILK